MRNPTTLTVAALLALGCGVVAQTSSPASRAPAAPAVAPPSTGVRVSRAVDPRAENYRRLQKPITVEITDQRLEDVMTFIGELTGANLEVLWSDGSLDGLDKDKKIHVTARDMSALRLLQRVLDKAAENADDATWQFTTDGSIEVGLKSSLNKHARLKIFDINDLLFDIPDFGVVPQLDLSSVLNQGGGTAGGGSGGGGGGGGQSIFQDQNQNDNNNGGPLRDTSANKAQKLIELIVANVDPPQWQDNGGSGGTITYQNGMLLVRAPEYMLRQIQGYAFMER